MKPCITSIFATNAVMVVLVAAMLMDVAGAGMLRSSSKHRQLRGFACNGFKSCLFAKGKIGYESCAGDWSCRYNEGTIGAHSCGGSHSCFENKGKIGDGSCLGDDSCSKITAAEIGNSSCSGGVGACEDITDATIGEDACVGDYACSGSSGGTIIGNGACKGDHACKNNIDTRIDEGCCVMGENYNEFYCTGQSNERITCEHGNSFKWTPPTEAPSNIGGGSLEPFPN